MLVNLLSLSLENDFLFAHWVGVLLRDLPLASCQYASVLLSRQVLQGLLTSEFLGPVTGFCPLGKTLGPSKHWVLKLTASIHMERPWPGTILQSHMHLHVPSGPEVSMLSSHVLQMKKMGLGKVKLLAQDQSSALISGTEVILWSQSCLLLEHSLSSGSWVPFPAFTNLPSNPACLPRHTTHPARKARLLLLQQADPAWLSVPHSVPSHVILGINRCLWMWIWRFCAVLWFIFITCDAYQVKRPFALVDWLA